MDVFYLIVPLPVTHSPLSRYIIVFDLVYYEIYFIVIYGFH